MAQPDQHHLGGGAAIRRGLHLAHALQQHLPGARQHRHRQPIGQRRTAGALRLRQFLAVAQRRHRLEAGDRVDQLQQVLQHHAEIGAAFVRQLGDLQRLARLAGHHRLQQVEHQAAVGQAQHVGDRRLGDRTIRLGDRLIQQRQPVAHRAIGRARDQIERGRLHRHRLLHRDAGEMRGQFRDPHPPQVEALAARQHGDRHLAQFGGGEHELHVRRRLLQRLQQRVERVARQHVDFVDDEHLGARLDRAVAGRLDDLAHVVDAGAAGGVHFHHVGVAVGQDRDAIGAYAAGIRGRPAGAVRAGAVQRAGDDAGGGGLAHPAHAGEHEGMGDPAGGEGVAQDAHHRLLADQVVEAGRAVFAGEHPVGRGMHRLGQRLAEQAGAVRRRRRL